MGLASKGLIDGSSRIRMPLDPAIFCRGCPDHPVEELRRVVASVR